MIFQNKGFFGELLLAALESLPMRKGGHDDSTHSQDFHFYFPTRSAMC